MELRELGICRIADQRHGNSNNGRPSGTMAGARKYHGLGFLPHHRCVRVVRAVFYPTAPPLQLPDCCVSVLNLDVPEQAALRAMYPPRALAAGPKYSSHSSASLFQPRDEEHLPQNAGLTVDG